MAFMMDIEKKKRTNDRGQTSNANFSVMDFVKTFVGSCHSVFGQIEGKFDPSQSVL